MNFTDEELLRQKASRVDELEAELEATKAYQREVIATGQAIIDKVHDLRDRMIKAEHRLSEMRDESKGMVDIARLDGKASGVHLAIGYLDEASILLVSRDH